MPAYSSAPPAPWRRDIASTVSDARDALSSWDGCMSVGYCKWPVIAGIIVGSLILLSLLFCLFRCLCCGAQCCCGCLSCCNACCPSPRKRGHKQLDSQPQISNPIMSPYTSHAPPAYAQTATFDASAGSAKYNEDALPPMPSWHDAPSRRVEQPAMKGDELLPTKNESPSQDNSASASTRLMSEAGEPQQMPARSPSDRNYDFPGQRPSPPPGPGHMQRQMSLSPPEDAYGFPGQRPSPSPAHSRGGYGYNQARQSPAPHMGGPPGSSHAGLSNGYHDGQETGVYEPASPSIYSQHSQPPSYTSAPLPPLPIPGSQYRGSPSPRPPPPPMGYQGFPPHQERVMHNASPYSTPNDAFGPYSGGFQQPPPPRPSRSPFQTHSPRMQQHSPAPGSWRNI